MSEISLEKRKEKELREHREHYFNELAKPKTSKALWACIEPPMKWGNQEMIRPLSNAALNAQSSERVTGLSNPKKDFSLDRPDKQGRPFFVHSTGRSSVIGEVSPAAMKGSASERTEALSHPKPIHASFHGDRVSHILGCGRSSPISQISPAAMKAGERERTSALAEPRAPHKEYQAPRSVVWPVSGSAMKGQINEHVEKLAQHKIRSDNGYREAQWTVTKPARNAKASNRVQELSQPKKLNDKYQPVRNVEWRVPKSALRAYATERLQQLSMPMVRDTMDHVQFDPMAFQVKESALKGRIPDRITELARPVIRT